MRIVNEKYLKVDNNIKRLENTIQKQFKEKQNRAVNSIAKLETLSPLKTLLRGYSVVEYNGKIVKSVKDIKIEDEIKIKIQDGNVKAIVKEVNL